MSNEDLSPNRKEIFSGSLVMFIGLYYLLTLVSGFLQSTGKPGSFGILQFKWLFTGVLYVSGGIAMFRMKRTGWLIVAATLLLHTMLMLLLVFRVIAQGEFNRFHIFPLLFFVIVLMALGFLFQKETRLRFEVNNKAYLLTIGLYLVLVVVNYVL